MDAHIFVRQGDIMISLRIAGIEVDEAGPFEDETDAVLAAHRMVYDGGQVLLPNKLEDKSTYMMNAGNSPGVLEAA